MQAQCSFLAHWLLIFLLKNTFIRNLVIILTCTFVLSPVIHVYELSADFYNDIILYGMNFSLLIIINKRLLHCKIVNTNYKL